jgi:aryl-alcohol dehydrogenase-like predicted oxidoreductase
MALPDYQWLRERLESDEGKKRIRAAEELRAVAADLGATLAQLAIAWCLVNPHVSTVILGATKAAQLSENLAALELVPKLDQSALERIESIVGNKPEPPPRY